MSQGPLCPNLGQKVEKEVSQMASRNLSCVILLKTDLLAIKRQLIRT